MAKILPFQSVSASSGIAAWQQLQDYLYEFAEVGMDAPKVIIGPSDDNTVCNTNSQQEYTARIVYGEWGVFATVGGPTYEQTILNVLDFLRGAEVQIEAIRFWELPRFRLWESDEKGA